MSKIIVSIVLTSMIILTTASGANSISKTRIETNFEKHSEVEMTNYGPIFVGEMLIIGNGNPDTAIVRSTAEQNIRINVPLGGRDVEFKAYYYIDCRGWFDHGYVTLWVRGASVKQIDNGEFAEGYLYTTVPDCRWGDSIEWMLTTTYYYFPTSPPIINVDGGGGTCSFPVETNTLYGTPLVLNMLNEKIGHLQSRQVTIKGTVVCK
ncbi:MAG: hypothetical protein QHH19_01190 [Candidatus Thermoplasmatota archaeon]|nr:hypothetical protein [Candidatus Thermoplasmatota archaeon]